MGRLGVGSVARSGRVARASVFWRLSDSRAADAATRTPGRRIGAGRAPDAASWPPRRGVSASSSTKLAVSLHRRMLRKDISRAEDLRHKQKRRRDKSCNLGAARDYKRSSGRRRALVCCLVAPAHCRRSLSWCFCRSFPEVCAGSAVGGSAVVDGNDSAVGFGRPLDVLGVRATGAPSPPNQRRQPSLPKRTLRSLCMRRSAGTSASPIFLVLNGPPVSRGRGFPFSTPVKGN